MLYCVAALLLPAGSDAALASSGYFSLGYGPVARQMAGATTALNGDAYAGASNPAKLLGAGDRTDIGVELFMPYRKVERSGSGTPFDFSSKSKNSLFFIPEGAFSRRLTNEMSWGVTVYGNGGLNTDYRDTTRIAGTNGNPAACANAPGNFLLGCGKLGFDLAQMVVAPTLAYQLAPGHTIGAAPLFAMQRFEAYGLQALAPLSKRPQDVSNRGYDITFGTGGRVGWLWDVTPEFSFGVAYASRIYMQRSEKYEGLFAGGHFDIPANLSIGIAVKSLPKWTAAFDYQRIFYSDVNALGNGVLNTLRDPINNPLGSAAGSGFNWSDTQTWRTGVAYEIIPALTLRAGYAFGKRPNDSSINSVTLNMLAPNPRHQASAGFSWKLDQTNEFHLAYSSYIKQSYHGPSATSVLGIGGEEKITPYVNTLMLAWSWKY